MCIILGFAIEMTAFQLLKLKISLNRARSSASTISQQHFLFLRLKKLVLTYKESFDYATINGNIFNAETDVKIPYYFN